MSQERQEFARHDMYAKYHPLWTKCRDATEGQDRIKARRTQYLRRPKAFDHEDYNQYLDRALFFGATGRTVEGLTGALVRKEPVVEFPESSLLERLGVRGDKLLDLIHSTLFELVSVGRVGHLVDAPPPDIGGGIPYVAEYKAEDILNWHEDYVDGRLKLIYVVLQERPSSLTDEFGKKTILEQYRVLRLGRPVDSNDPGPVYFQEIWQRSKNDQGEANEELRRVDTVTPRLAGGRPLNEIPFVFTNASGEGSMPEKPPLLDLVNTNLSHYANSADLEWGRHYTALPTPYVTGIDEGQTSLKIGSTTAWLIQASDARVGMLEFSGAGLGHIQEGMVAKQKMMAALGSRLLEEQKAAVEAAEALNIRTNSEGATLMSIARRTSYSWSKILQLVRMWATATTVTSSISVEINTDFNPKKMPSDELTALMLAYQNQLISFDVWYWHLQQGEMLPPGLTKEELEAQLQAGGPGDVDGATEQRVRAATGEDTDNEENEDG